MFFFAISVHHSNSLCVHSVETEHRRDGIKTQVEHALRKHG